MEIKTLHFEKLTGEGAGKIRVALIDIPGVQEIAIDLDNSSLTVTYDENQVGLIALERKIADMGYPVKGSE